MNFQALRRQALLKDLKRDNLDALLVTHPVNVHYLTGFTGDSSYLLVSARHTILISDARFEGQIAEECPGLEAVIRGHDKSTEEAAAETIHKAGLKTVGLEPAHATLAFAESIAKLAAKSSLVPSTVRVEELRAVKDASEVELIRASIRVAERAFAMFKAFLREADTEKDLHDAMEGFIRRAGGEQSAFPVIAAAGERSALPHAPPTSNILGDSSKLLIDWGAVRQGYHSDLTRTFRSPFPPAPTRKNKPERAAHDFEKIYSIVKAAQDAAIAAVRDGVPGKEVDAAARKVIDDAGYGAYFNHGLGHGIGLEIHEAPRVRRNSTDTLQAGMVITLEPGIYLPGWGGIRLEDDILVQRDGCTVLSSLPRDLDALERF